MRHNQLLDVREIEHELEQFVRERLSKAQLSEGSSHISGYDEHGQEIPMPELAERHEASGGGPLLPGATHYAQLRIEGPWHGSGAIEGVVHLFGSDWELKAEAGGRERGQEPFHYRQTRLAITEGTHLFVMGLRAAREQLAA